MIETTGVFEEFRVCNLYSLPGLDEGCLALLLTFCEGVIERRRARKLLSQGPFGDHPFGLYFVVAVRISSAGDELPHLGR